MNHAHRVGRWLAGLTRHASFPLAGPAVVAAAQPPLRWTTRSPLPAPARADTTSQPGARTRPQVPRRRLRMMVTPAWLPHTIQLCVHCRENPAGFWVSRTGGTVRRPWCLSCCQELDRGHCDMILFGG